MTIDELIALNDEIAALVRAGVPLEQGLADLGEDLPGRLGQFTTALAERTARGESLDQALADDATPLPPVYRAVVRAGVRAGRLPAALEAVATAARRLAETHRATVVAALYPLLVILAAWCGLVFFACVLAPRLAALFASLEVPGGRLFATMAWAGRWGSYWGPIVPIILLLLVVAGWWASRRAGALESHATGWLIVRASWMGRMLRCSRTATFLEVLALLVENRIPLPEAVILAAEASGDRATIRWARQLADALQSGQTSVTGGGATFPPLVNWLLLSANREGALLPALRHAAATYHRRAQHQSDLLRLFFPIVLTVVAGGCVTALYAVALFAPYAAMLRGLGG